jgi:hypothetical protein
MPKSTVAEESAYPIPLDTPIPLRLDKVELFTHEYTVKSGRNAGSQAIFRKWEWDFTVIDGEYAGLTVRGNTEPKVTNLTEPTGSLHLARPWIEALLGRELDLGEEVDTDDLLGLTAIGTVLHAEPREKKDGNGYWYNVELDELFPASPRSMASNGFQAQPQDPWAAGQAGDKPPF